MEITIRITPDLKELMARLGPDFEAGMSAGMQNLVSAIEAHAVKEAPVESGNLANAITSYVLGRGMTGVVKTTDAALYAIYVHEGTGIYGPKGQRIYPIDKKALWWPGAKHPVRSVAGQRPNRFMLRGVERAKPLERHVERGINAYLTRRGW